MDTKKDIPSLCRIKVNKMINSLNTNKNIFIPKYTISNKKEEKYSYLTKSKGNSFKTSHNKKPQNLNLKRQMSKNNTSTTEENYTKQPIDFIIDHGVLIYQRDLKGEEVINLGINNEYLRKNKFNMIKNNNTIYQTESNFRPKKNNNSNNIINNSSKSKQSYSNQKKIKLNNSKKTLISTSDIPLTRKKDSSSRQKKIHSTNLNTTQNSISSINSISIKTFLVSSKNKNENNKNNINSNIKNTKKVINFIRKKNINNNNQNKYLIYKKRKNYSAFCPNEDEKVILNNKTEINDNYIIPNIKDIKYRINYNTNKYKKIEEKKINFNISENNNPNNYSNNSDIKLKISKLFMNIDNILKYYLKFYLQILMDYSLGKNLYKTEYKEDIINNNKNNKIQINRIILDKSKQNHNCKNTCGDNIQEHKKSNSIIVNKKVSSNRTSTKELPKNHSNKNLNILIPKNLRFLSNDKTDINKNEQGKSELYRDSKSLQKKYEQICRRKKRQLTMTFPKRIKNGSPKIENNFLSDNNKTNSFSNLNDNSVNSFQIKNNNKKNNQIFFKDSPNNSNNNIKENNKNSKDNKIEKNIYKIKLIKNNNKDKKIISYRIEKAIPNKYINNNVLTEKNNYIENKIDKIINNIKITENNKSKKNSFNSNNNKVEDDINNNELNNKINNKIFIHKRKNYILEEKNNYKIKELYFKKGKNIIKQNKPFRVKNICTKDKRISIYISYMPYTLNSLSNINKNFDNSLLKMENTINYNYIIKNKKNKKIIRRKNDLEERLTLIREEDEKSKCLNSTKSSKLLEDEINPIKKNTKNLRLSKDLKKYNLKLGKIVYLLEKVLSSFYISDKNRFLLNLKIICLVTHIRKIVNNKIRDTNIIKYITKKNKDKMIYYPKIKKQKRKKNISNIYIKDKIFFNNIIINENIINSHSFDCNKNIRGRISPKLNRQIYYKNNDDKNELLNYECKTDYYRINLNDYKI